MTRKIDQSDPAFFERLACSEVLRPHMLNVRKFGAGTQRHARVRKEDKDASSTYMIADEQFWQGRGSGDPRPCLVSGFGLDFIGGWAGE